MNPERIPFSSIPDNCIAIIVSLNDYYTYSEIITRTSCYLLKLEIPHSSISGFSTEYMPDTTKWIVSFILEEDLLYLKLSTSLKYNIIDKEEVILTHRISKIRHVWL